MLIAARHHRFFVECRTSTVFRVCQHFIYQTGRIGSTLVAGIIVRHIEVTSVASPFLLSVFLTNAPCHCEMVKLVILKEVFVVSSHFVLSRLDNCMREVSVFDIKL